MINKGRKEYSATPELKEKIIYTARKLFYEQGYKQTYLEQIASECGIAKTQISYHLKSKPNLAKEVAKQYTWEMKNNISLKYYNLCKEEQYDLRVSTAVEIQIMDQLYCQDSKAYRFYKERADSNFEDMFFDANINLYEVHNRRYQLNLDVESDEISMIGYASLSSAIALRMAFMDGRLNCTFDQYNDYACRIPFRFMNLSPEIIDEVIQKSKEILNVLEYEIKPYFVVV